MKDNILQSQCRNLLKDYEEVLIRLLELEKKGVENSTLSSKSQYDLTKDYWFTQGVKEGLKRLIARINKEAQ